MDKFCPYTFYKNIIDSKNKKKLEEEKSKKLFYDIYKEKNFSHKVIKTLEDSPDETFDIFLEKIANFYLESLKNDFSEQYLEMVLNIKDKDEIFTWFWSYFKIIFSDFIFENLKFTEKQKEILEQSLWKKYKNLDENFIWGLISQAFLDIFLLKILQKKYKELDDKKINQIIQKNMFSWSTIRGDISSVIIFWIKNEKTLDEILKKLWYLNEEINLFVANCPFFHTKNQKTWIKEMIKFFDEKIIPKIPENSYFFNFK